MDHLFPSFSSSLSSTSLCFGFTTVAYLECTVLPTSLAVFMPDLISKRNDQTVEIQFDLLSLLNVDERLLLLGVRLAFLLT